MEIDAYNLQLGKSRTILAGEWQPREPRWSPDGKRILFYSNGAKPGIYYLNLNDSSVNAIRLEANSR
jgi:Tol biopolymer transport system component